MRDTIGPVTLGPPPRAPLARVTPDRALPALPSAAWIAVLFFVGAETMIFAGLLTAFGIYRHASPVWPPFGEPRLPIAVTAANTVLLVLSAGTMRAALARLRLGQACAGRQALRATAVLGAIFLAVQGGEWVRLVGWGLRAASGPYGGFYYTLIGAHGIHVVGAVVALAVLVARGGGLPPLTRLEACGLYWYFVCGLWLVIFAVVYLS